MSVRVPYYPQLEERDCGATCLRMVAEFYGGQTSMEELRTITQTDIRGTDLGGIEKGAKALGFDTISAELPYDELSQGDLLPVILHWDRDHFVVVTAADYQRVTIHDPAQGKRVLSRDDFESHRYGPGRSRAGLILRPSEGQTLSNDSPISNGKLTQVSSPSRVGLMLALVFFASVFAYSLFTLYQVVTQAVDLQFREGWIAHLGALLLCTAGLALASYIVQRMAILRASKLGNAEIGLITDHVQTRAADITRPLNKDTYLTLLQDSDQLKVWRAYELGTLVKGGSVVLVAVLGLFAIDAYIGGATVVSSLILLATEAFVFKYSKRNKEIAKEAQVKQREALYEFAAVLPQVTNPESGEYLNRRMTERNSAAENAFHNIAMEYSSQQQLVRVTLLFCFVTLLTFSFYQLGYSGLQVGELLFVFCLLFIAMLPLRSIYSSWIKWRGLEANRLRLAELIEPSSTGMDSRFEKPKQLTLKWDGPQGKPQRISFPSDCRIAFVGSDEKTRHQLIQAMLGRSNEINAGLFFDENDEAPRNLKEFGKLSLINADSIVASGSLASNIAMTARPNDLSLNAAAQMVGLPIDAPPHGLHRLVGFAGEGISDEVASKTLIARAVYMEADVLVLDEATAALGPYDEGLLMDNLIPWSAGRLLVVNPSRINAAYGCDLLVHIEAGEIDSVGSHEELLEEKGSYYYQIVASQQKIS